MKRLFLLAALAVAALIVIVAVVLVLAAADDDDGDDPVSRDTSAGTTTPAPAVVADDAWCSGWDQLVQTQGAYVASPTQPNGDAVLAALDGLEALGVPESLDPSGYTELTAVLDDVRASVDDSFTPSVVPSEPADVESDNAAEAPFGAWLAEYCPR